MFVLREDEEFTWPVRVRVPCGGEWEERSFTGRFRLLGSKELEKLALESDAALARGVLSGWSEVSCHDGSEAEFREEMRERALDMGHIRAGVLRAYFEALEGVLEKN